VPLLGGFDPAFLEVPPEVIQLTARTNQKYFVCRKPSPLQGRGLGEGDADLHCRHPRPPTPSPEGEGESANAFVCTANIEAADAGAGIVDGNRKVLARRLSDARFFWEQDRSKTLAQHAEKLGNIVFHEKLGTVATEVQRVARLAEWLAARKRVPTAIPRWLDKRPSCARPTSSPRWSGSSRTAGTMGGYYARAEGLPRKSPTPSATTTNRSGRGDDVPTRP
jgi:glycyl-tRNA synthetase beta chain